jgi:hypothetical protein
MRRLLTTGLALLLAAGTARAADPIPPTGWPRPPAPKLPETPETPGDSPILPQAIREQLPGRLAGYFSGQAMSTFADQLERLVSNAADPLNEPLLAYVETLADPRAREAVQKARTAKAPVYARLALLDGKPDEALAILDKALGASPDIRNDFIALWLQRHDVKGAAAIPEIKKLLDAIGDRKPPPNELNYMAVLLYHLTGNDTQAIPFATVIPRDRNHDTSYFLLTVGKYDDAHRIFSVLDGKPIVEYRIDECFGNHERAWATFQQWRDEQRKTKPAFSPSALASAYRWWGLLDEAVAQHLADGSPPHAQLALLDGLRLRDALAIPVTGRGADWTARKLHEMGFGKEAAKLLRSAPIDPKVRGAVADAAYRVSTWRLLGQAGEAKTAEDALWNEFVPVATGSSDQDINRGLHPDYAISRRFQFWFDTATNYRDDRAVRFKKAQEILDGAIAPVFDKAWEDDVNSFRNIDDAVDALHALGLDEKAGEVVERRCQREGNWSQESLLGDVELAANHPEKALAHYHRAAAYDPINASLLYRTGIAMSRIPASAEEGRRRIVFAQYLVLGSRHYAGMLAEEMKRRESPAAGARFRNEYEAAFGLYGPDPADLARARQAALDKGDVDAALALVAQERYFNSDEGFRIFHRVQALHCLAHDDGAGLLAAVSKLLDNGPPDVELFEKVWPALCRGDASRARRLRDTAVQRLADAAALADQPDGYIRQRDRLKSLP